MRFGRGPGQALTATYLDQNNPDVHLKKAPTTEKGLLHVPVLVSHGAFPETGHSFLPCSSLRDVSPFGNSCHGTPIAPQCPLLLTHIPLPLPLTPSPHLMTHKVNRERPTNTMLDPCMTYPTRLAFPNSVMTASVSHSVTSRGPVPAGSGGALMPEPGAQSDAFPSHVC